MGIPKFASVPLSLEQLWNGSRGRVVKASDSKSDSLWERRFESYQLREYFKDKFPAVIYINQIGV